MSSVRDAQLQERSNPHVTRIGIDFPTQILDRFVPPFEGLHEVAAHVQQRPGDGAISVQDKTDRRQS
jgi:hypothetical protein